MKKCLAIVLDDHLLFAESMIAMLERLKLFDAVIGFTDQTTYIRYLAAQDDTPVYCFIDYYLPDRNALPLVQETRRINKQARIVIVSSVTSLSVINLIRTFEPNGFISKSSSSAVLLECIRRIECNEAYLCPAIHTLIPTLDIPPDTPRFTARELEILQLFASGLSVADTAEKIHLSRHTVISHRRKLMDKTNTTSITQLLAYARALEIT